MFYKRSISAKIILLQLTLVVLVVLASGSVCYQMMKSYLEADEWTHLQSHTKAVANLIDNRLNSIEDTMGRIANSPGLANFIKTSNAHALEEDFAPYRNILPVLSFANTLGEEEVKVTHGDPDHNLINISQSKNFQASKQHPNTLLISKPAWSATLSEDVLDLGFRYVDYFDDFLGYIHATLPVRELQETLEPLRMNNRSFVVVTDQHNTIILSPVTQYLSAQLEKSDTSPELVYTPELREEFNGIYRMMGEESLVSMAIVPKTQWKVFLALPVAEFNRTIDELRNTLIILALLLAVIGSLIARQFSRTLAKPIEILTAATTEIETLSSTQNGDVRQVTSRRVEWKSNDELGRLVGAYNNMLDQLEQSQAELIESQQELDNIVSSMVDALIVTSPDGKIIRINHAVSNMLKYAEEDLLGRQIDSLIAKERDRFSEIVSSDLAAKGASNGTETTLLSKEYLEIPVIFSCSTLLDTEGNQRGIVYVAKDITEHKQAEENLNYLANYDTLTGLPNRMLFLDRLEQSMKRLPWHDRFLAVLFLDLDRFKVVNDSLGHDVGDHLLKEVAERITSCVRDGDVVSRHGGDEFVILLIDINKQSNVIRVAKKILHILEIPFDLGEQEFVATSSIGISLYPGDGDSPQTLLKNADSAMYRAKEAGRNNYQLYTACMNEEAHEQMAMESAIRRGIEQNEFILHYQPQVSLQTGQITGVEALVRWHDPERGLIPPYQFLPLAEETGLIISIGEQVLYQACRLAKAWQDEGLPPITMAVNIAERQFKQIDLPKLVHKVLNETGLSPEYLDLELTEGILMDQVDKATEVLQQLKAMGVRLSIDDFGTGYSSLSYLKRFPLDKLKIDRSFIMDIPSDSDDIAITSAVIQLGKSLDLTVVAEGVEDQQQLAFLHGKECELVQGYFFSRPVPAEEMRNMLKEGRSLDNEVVNLISMNHSI